MKRQAWIAIGLAFCLLAGCSTASRKPALQAASSSKAEPDGSTPELDALRAAGEVDCRFGDQLRCARSAFAYATALLKLGLQRPPSKAETATSLGLFLQACDLGHADSCYQAGKIQEKQGSPELARQNIQKAMPMLARACDETRDRAACIFLGDICRIGKYAPKDKAKMLSWYQKSDQILSHAKAKQQKALEEAKAFCRKKPSTSCAITVNQLQQVSAAIEFQRFLVPLMKSLKYDAETMSSAVPPKLVEGQWSSLVDIANFKADGTATLQSFTCDLGNSSVQPGKIEKGSWRLSGNHLLVLDGPRQIHELKVLFASPNTLNVLQNGLEISYKRASSPKPFCQEYIEKESSGN